MEDNKEIFIFHNWQLKLAHQINEGLIRYAQQKNNWHLTTMAFSVTDTWDIRDWHIDGLIIPLSKDRKRNEQFSEASFPIINCGNPLIPFPNIPQIDTSLTATGQMAADYFLGSGFENFACIQFEHNSDSNRRTKRFCGRLAEKGIPESNITTLKSRRPTADHIPLNSLIDLPKPLAVYCVTDMFASEAARCCVKAGLNVPDDVAILGTEDDDALCRRSRPYISSIRLPYERIGYEAAKSLDLLMQGKSVPERCDFQPVSVIVRQSTDTLAIKDEATRRVVAHIRKYAVENPSIKELTRVAGISKSLLHTRFKEILGNSPQQQIIVEKLKMVKSLLLSSNLNIDEIAHQTGFSSDQHLYHTFQRKTGQTPGAYRKSFGK